MLLRFGVTNYLSFLENQEISLVASSLTDRESGLIRSPKDPDNSVLPCVIIYGANASGKSNLVQALMKLCGEVLYSNTQNDPDGGVQRVPFALDATCDSTNSVFDIDFIMKGIRYHYGFEASDERFESEWLYAYPKGRRQVLFTREGQRFEFGRALKGRNKIISDLTRPNSLFVSTGAQNDHSTLMEVRRFFRSINFYGAISVPGGMISLGLDDSDIDQRAIDFLKKVGTGVTGFRRQEIDLSEETMEFGRAFKEIIKKFNPEVSVEEIFEEKKRLKLELSHRGSGGDKVYLDIDRESAGTRRLLLMLGPIFRALDEGTLIVIDELDASLHTRACEAILELFGSQKTNPHGAQLVVTTHDTNLLHSPLVRRDQIRFVELNKKGATRVFPLTDFRTRKDDNLEKGYLQGRYGAIPNQLLATDLIHES